MELPLILAGPILRRVDPSTVAVWMAFSEPADLELRVWEGRVAHDTTNPVFVSSDDPPDPSAPPPRPGAEAIRIGEHLYLGLVTARIPPASGKVFQPDLLYSYDVVINAGGEVLGLGERGTARHPHRQRRRGAAARIRRPDAAELRPAPVRARPSAHRVRLVPAARLRRRRRAGLDR